MTPLRLLTAFLLAAAAGLSIIAWRRALDHRAELARLTLDPLELTLFPTWGPGEEPPPELLGGVVLVGDSHMALWPAETLPRELRVVQRGIVGQTSVQVANRYRAHVAPLRPRTVVLHVGTNDLMNTAVFPERAAGIVAECKSSIEQIVVEARLGGATVVVLTVLPLGDNPRSKNIEELPAAYARAAAEVNDFISALATDGVVVVKSDSVIGDGSGGVRDGHGDDSGHISVRGYQALGEAVSAALSDR